MTIKRRAKFTIVDYIKKPTCPRCGGVLELQTSGPTGNILVCENEDYTFTLPHDGKIAWYNRVRFLFENNKTVFGLLLMGTGKLISLVVPPVGEGIFYLGSAVSAYGGSKKIVKAVNRKKLTDQRREVSKGGWWNLLIEILRAIYNFFMGR